MAAADRPETAAMPRSHAVIDTAWSRPHRPWASNTPTASVTTASSRFSAAHASTSMPALQPMEEGSSPSIASVSPSAIPSV